MKQWLRYGVVGLCGLLLLACGTPDVPATALPTLGPILAQVHQPESGVAGAVPRPTAARPSAQPSVQPSAGAAAPTPSGQPEASADPLEDYRQLMEDARATHPYPESVETMWAVMMCESSGIPTIQGPGGLTGLFQYQPSTWAGAWNPYRDQPITDARAQIYATAKAWSDGNQHWWGVCLPQ